MEGGNATRTRPARPTQLKILFVGDSGVGKTTLVKQLVSSRKSKRPQSGTVFYSVFEGTGKASGEMIKLQMVRRAEGKKGGAPPLSSAAAASPVRPPRISPRRRCIVHVSSS